MNASYRFVKALGAGSLLAVALSFTTFVVAGPGSEFWNPTKPVTTTKEAAAVKPDATVAMVCTACKTVRIHEFRHVGPLGKGHDEWPVIGSKHQCGSCGGEIAVVKGKTTDSMQHNCTKCGQGAAFCCVAPALDGKAPETKK